MRNLLKRIAPYFPFGSDELTPKEITMYIQQYQSLLQLEGLKDVVFAIFNYSTFEIELITENTIYVFGYTAQEIRSLGFSKFQRLFFHPKDVRLLTEKAYPFMMKFINQQSMEVKKSIQCTYNFRGRRKDGLYRQYMRNIVPIRFSETGKMLLSFTTIVDITNIKTDDSIYVKVSKQNHHKQYEKLFQKVFFHKGSVLSARELEILQGLVQGLTSKEIASKMFISTNTVTTHRRNMLKKTGCKNVSELIGMARNRAWI